MIGLMISSCKTEDGLDGGTPVVKTLPVTVATSSTAVLRGSTTGGTGSHTWYYRKWASGMEEAWGMCSANAVTGSVWASPIYYYNWNVTWPDIFTSAPTQVYITSRNDQWIPVGHGTPTKTGSYIRMMKPSSSSQALAVDIYLVHR